jgi:hypothetical protein
MSDVYILVHIMLVIYINNISKMFAGGVSYSHVHSSVTIRTAVGSENSDGHKFIMKLCTGYAVLNQIIKYCTLTTDFFLLYEYQ